MESTRAALQDAKFDAKGSRVAPYRTHCSTTPKGDCKLRKEDKLYYNSDQRACTGFASSHVPDSRDQVVPWNQFSYSNCSLTSDWQHLTETEGIPAGSTSKRTSVVSHARVHSCADLVKTTHLHCDKLNKLQKMLLSTNFFRGVEWKYEYHGQWCKGKQNCL